jgi:hypothetical protein
LEELVAGLLRPRLFPFGKLSKAKPAAQVRLVQKTRAKTSHAWAPLILHPCCDCVNAKPEANS